MLLLIINIELIKAAVISESYMFLFLKKNAKLKQIGLTRKQVKKKNFHFF